MVLLTYLMLIQSGISHWQIVYSLCSSLHTYMVCTSATFSKWLSFRIASHNSLSLILFQSLTVTSAQTLAPDSARALFPLIALHTLGPSLLFATFEWFVFAISFNVWDDEATERESEIKMNRTNGKQKEFAWSQFSPQIHTWNEVGLNVFEIFIKLKNFRHSRIINISFSELE